MSLEPRLGRQRAGGGRETEKRGDGDSRQLADGSEQGADDSRQEAGGRRFRIANFGFDKLND